LHVFLNHHGWLTKMQTQEYHKEAPKLSDAATFSSQTSRDFEEQASLLMGWNQDYAQLSSGAFIGYVTDLHFDDMHLFLEFTNQSLFQNGQLNDDVIAIGVPLALNSPGIFCGTACNDYSLHIFSGKDGFEFYSPMGLIMAGITLKRSELIPLLGDNAEQLLNRLCAHSHLMNLGHQKLQALRDLMSGAFEMLHKHPAIAFDHQAMSSLKQNILTEVANCLCESEQCEQQISMTKCWSILGESRQFVHEHCDSPISVADLCEHLDISRRSLQYSFQQYLNTNPIAYLRAERLNGVRRMLKTANSVTEAAAHWGFWHFGHFAQEYKKMFGELPSATFRRLHQLN